MAVGTARHQPSPGCTLLECGGFSYALRRFWFSDREFNKAVFKKISLFFCLKSFVILLFRVKCAVERLAGAWGGRAVVYIFGIFPLKLVWHWTLLSCPGLWRQERVCGVFWFPSCLQRVQSWICLWQSAGFLQQGYASIGLLSFML